MKYIEEAEAIEKGSNVTLILFRLPSKTLIRRHSSLFFKFCKKWTTISKNHPNSRTISLKIISTKIWPNSLEDSIPRKSTHSTELFTISRSTPSESASLLWWPAEFSLNQPLKTTTRRKMRLVWKRNWQLKSQKSTRSVSPSWTEQVIVEKLFEFTLLKTMYLFSSNHQYLYWYYTINKRSFLQSLFL